MQFLSRIFYLYYDGFRNMTLGRSLWLVIILKLLIIFGFLKIFIYDKSLKTNFQTQEEKSKFVSKNLTEF
ncbi:DUF4492 domain-containing protein [Helicobacter canadensis]|uniref:DUF4492 domain-containing protein n=1 Tax=Helicobacter canadensis MIT 98-5491 TaxID=537970 RepID=C5ZVG4_9HELI|nr:DUF4492 domain-containing protein [Helicobacter canadensis]EES89088.1 hypothetical protein HCAN_0370 [Helicobacter canadensis MIT 98-5491]EFR47865.1 hypothetical protein HCMG_00038 [Helicobacter canadensis MIT 98-5491]STO99119.1 Uncharacterised protein [Helicobacter canadensis]